MKLSEQITQGPWGVYEYPTLVHCDDTLGNLVADCSGNRTTLPRTEKVANAKAIAAVPEMLSLLERIEVDFRNSDPLPDSWMGKHYSEIEKLLKELNK